MDFQKRQASDDSYRAIRENGLLVGASLAIYDILFRFGPLTAGEVFGVCIADNLGHVKVKGAVCGRLTELSRKGVVRSLGRRKCGYTGQVVTLYDVTDRLPIGSGRLEEAVGAKITRLENDLAWLQNRNRELEEEAQRLRRDVGIGQLVML